MSSKSYKVSLYLNKSNNPKIRITSDLYEDSGYPKSLVFLMVCRKTNLLLLEPCYDLKIGAVLNPDTLTFSVGTVLKSFGVVLPEGVEDLDHEATLGNGGTICIRIKGNLL